MMSHRAQNSAEEWQDIVLINEGSFYRSELSARDLFIICGAVVCSDSNRAWSSSCLDGINCHGIHNFWRVGRECKKRTRSSSKFSKLKSSKVSD
jgi:hypothetical protein